MTMKTTTIIDNSMYDIIYWRDKAIELERKNKELQEQLKEANRKANRNHAMASKYGGEDW